MCVTCNDVILLFITFTIAIHFNAMVSLLWVLSFHDSDYTSQFAKAIMHDEMEKDNGSLGLKHLLYVENISAATFQISSALISGVKIFH